MMAAAFLDEQPSEDGLDDLPSEQNALDQTQLADALGEPAQEAPSDVPEKYQGKSIQEVVSMHQEAEKVIGRQGGEVGELRGIVDDYIRTQIAAEKQTETPAPEPVDFFEDPAAAVSQAIATHPGVVKAKQKGQQSVQQASLSRIREKHPDMGDVISSQSFVDWVQASPIRSELYARADANFDYDAADELISNFKEKTASAAATIQVETAARQQQVKAAQTGGATGAGTGGAKRVYRRVDIIKLMKTDPDRYDRLQPEIMAAYQEGRVK